MVGDLTYDADLLVAGHVPGAGNKAAMKQSVTATPADPFGLRLRRRFTFFDRELSDIFEEDFTDPDSLLAPNTYMGGYGCCSGRGLHLPNGYPSNGTRPVADGSRRTTPTSFTWIRRSRRRSERSLP